MGPSHFGLENEASRKLRIEYYEKELAGRWNYVKQELSRMLSDAVWESEDLEAYCRESFGVSVKALREVSGGNLRDALHVESVPAKNEDTLHLPIEVPQSITEQLIEKKVKSAAERAREYRERRKAGK